MENAVFIVGAEPHWEFGAPSTGALDDIILDFLRTDEVAQHSQLIKLYTEIHSALARYYGQHGLPNFEQIYHVAHELAAMEVPGERTVLEYRPVLQPFLGVNTLLDFERLRRLGRSMIRAIYETMSEASQTPRQALWPLAGLFAEMEDRYRCRIYTTNYDDFLHQARPDYYTGFTLHVSDGVRAFDRDTFFEGTDRNALFYLHGSVHFGFPHGIGEEIGELFWFDKLTDALRFNDFLGSDSRRMDGTQIARTPILTGLDKLGRLQEKPMSFFQTEMARDIMRADVIFVIGCGLSDLHINAWIKQARSKSTPPKLVMVDYWGEGFRKTMLRSEYGRKEITMSHEFHIHADLVPSDEFDERPWTIGRGSDSAIYDQGFWSFLTDTDSRNRVFKTLDIR